MSKSRSKTPKQPVVPQRDPSIVAIARPTRSGFELMSVRSVGTSFEVLDTRHSDAGHNGTPQWITTQRAARTVIVLAGADVIVRAVQLPSSDESRLEGALQLNAMTFVLGRTSAWRVASALLPRERGSGIGIRTGMVAEWPEDADYPKLPTGVTESVMVSFAPAIAGLAALAAMTEDPLIWVDAATGVMSVCIPTSVGLLARVVRAGGDGEEITPSDVAQTVGEACVHGGVSAGDIPQLIERAVNAARNVLGGGFGCSDADLDRLQDLVTVNGISSNGSWWREHGLSVGLAAAALGPAMPLTQLHSVDLGARPDRAGALINRISEPRNSKRLLIAGLLAVVLGPPLFEGARLLLLRWKLPDLSAYVRAEEIDRKKQAMYRVLGRQGASMTKTLSDIACSAPDGVEIEFVNVTQSAKGQAVTLRGKTRPAGGLQGTEVMLALEQNLRESGAFESIQRNSEAPDTRGYQEFTINATAIRPTYTVAFPEAQDFARTSMRERRFGPPPADVDLGSSGVETADSGAGTGSLSGRSRGSTSRGSSSEATSTTGSGKSGGANSTAAPQSGTSSADAVAAASTPKDSAKPAGSTGASVTGTAPAAKPTTTTESSTTAASGETESGADARSARAGRGATRSGLATRSNPGGSSAPEPPPPPVSENEINQMSREEARETLVKVSKSRQRADLDEATQKRLKTEFDLLLERCKKS